MERHIKFEKSGEESEKINLIFCMLCIFGRVATHLDESAL